jgi:hypothetical protein
LCGERCKSRSLRAEVQTALLGRPKGGVDIASTKILDTLIGLVLAAVHEFLTQFGFLVEPRNILLRSCEVGSLTVKVDFLINTNDIVNSRTLLLGPFILGRTVLATISCSVDENQLLSAILMLDLLHVAFNKAALPA